MSNENQYKQLFHAIMKYEEEMHLKNQKRIKIGIQCLIWIPMVFLILLFLTESDKVVFLVLWIISLFVIAVYLIYVEYVDFQMQEKIAEISSGEPIEANALIGQDISDEVGKTIEAQDIKGAGTKKGRNKGKG